MTEDKSQPKLTQIQMDMWDISDEFHEKGLKRKKGMSPSHEQRMEC